MSNTCDKCEHFKDGESCDLMEDDNTVEGDRNPTRCYAADYETFRAWVIVGPKFGCIHWVEKEST